MSIECPLLDTPSGCYEDTHHDEWGWQPQTPLERRFVNLPHLKRQLPRCVHNSLHADRSLSPEKPHPEFVRFSVAASFLIGDTMLSDAHIKRFNLAPMIAELAGITPDFLRAALYSGFADPREPYVVLDVTDFEIPH